MENSRENSRDGGVGDEHGSPRPWLPLPPSLHSMSEKAT